MTESSTELKLVKLLIVMQVHLELLDELQTTPIYRHNIKRSVNNLSKDLELQLNMLYKNMKTDNDVEEAYNAVKHGGRHSTCRRHRHLVQHLVPPK